MARFSYGGQALIEGVLMRGRNSIAVALRHPDGRIVWADEQLAVGFRATRWARLPFVRGLVVLYETLVVGTRWLVRSAGVAAAEELPSMAPLEPAPPTPHTSQSPDTARDPAIMLANEKRSLTICRNCRFSLASAPSSRALRTVALS